MGRKESERLRRSNTRSKIAGFPPLIDHNVILNITPAFFKYVHICFSVLEQNQGKIIILLFLSELVGPKPVLRGSVNWFVAVVDHAVSLPRLPKL